MTDDEIMRVAGEAEEISNRLSTIYGEVSNTYGNGAIWDAMLTLRQLARHVVKSATMANGLTRAETKATPSCAGLTVKPWEEWHGDEKPVKSHDLVEVRFRNEGTEIDFANGFYWNHYGDGDDIIAYRVL